MMRGSHPARGAPRLATSVQPGAVRPRRGAPSASLLVVNLAHVEVEDAPGWEYSEFARYDLGQAVAHMTIQGLSVEDIVWPRGRGT